MRAVTIEHGRLVVAERPDPEPGRGELLVRVAAAGPSGTKSWGVSAAGMGGMRQRSPSDAERARCRFFGPRAQPW